MVAPVRIPLSAENATTAIPAGRTVWDLSEGRIEHRSIYSQVGFVSEYFDPGPALGKLGDVMDMESAMFRAGRTEFDGGYRHLYIQPDGDVKVEFPDDPAIYVEGGSARSIVRQRFDSFVIESKTATAIRGFVSDRPMEGYLPRYPQELARHTSDFSVAEGRGSYDARNRFHWLPIELHDRIRFTDGVGPENYTSDLLYVAPFEQVTFVVDTDSSAEGETARPDVEFTIKASQLRAPRIDYGDFYDVQKFTVPEGTSHVENVTDTYQYLRLIAENPSGDGVTDGAGNTGEVTVNAR